MTRSIEISGNIKDDELKFNAEGEVIDAEVGVIDNENPPNSFTVIIDGKDTGGGFRYETDEEYDWFDVDVTDNKFTVIVKENFDVTERVGHIFIHHNCIIGEDGERIISVTQKGVECNIEIGIDDNIITFNSTWGTMKSDKQTYTVTLNITGGDRNFFVKGCREYVADCIDCTTDPYVGHKFLIIGGVKWATMNVGADSVTDTGLYFQWGDTQGYTAEQVGTSSGQKYFGWADYKFGNGTSSPTTTDMTKYNATDGKTVLDLEDDAVRVNWGGLWRMPTKKEFQDLIKSVNTEWTTDYDGSGVSGLICTDKTDSSRVLFFPACGYSGEGYINDVGSYGYYWGSSLDSGYIMDGLCLCFDSDNIDWVRDSRRCYGFAVRGVNDYIGMFKKQIPFDNGIKIQKTGKNELTITNYGRIAQEEDVQYEITLAHNTDPSVTKTITVIYDE